MDTIIIVREITLMLWGAAIGIMTALGVFMRKKNEISPGIYGPVGIMMLLAAVSELLQLISFYWLEESFLSTYLASFGIGLEYMGFAFLVRHIELKIGNYTRQAFTFMSLIITGVSFAGVDLRKVDQIPLYIFLPIAVIMLIAGLSVPAMYGYIAKLTAKDVRRRSIIAGIGFFIFLSALLIQESTVHYLAPWGILWFESTFGLPYGPLPPGAAILGMTLIAYALHTIQIK